MSPPLLFMVEVLAIVKFIPALNVPPSKFNVPPLAIVLPALNVTVPDEFMVSVPVKFDGKPLPVFCVAPL